MYWTCLIKGLPFELRLVDLTSADADDRYHFGGFPKLRAWLNEMEDLPFHDEAHLYNTTLGDIRSEPNTQERMASAMEAPISALSGLASSGVRVRV